MSRLITGVLLAMGIVVLCSLSPPLLAASLLAVPVIRWLSGRFVRRAEPVQRRYRERYAASLDVIEQGLSGAKLLHLLWRCHAWIDAVERHLDEQYDVRIELVGVNNRYFPLLEFFWVFITAAIIGAGAALYAVDLVTIGVVTAFVLSLTRVFGPLENLGRLIGDAQSAKASLGRIFALLDIRPDVQEVPEAKELPVSGCLEAGSIYFFLYAGTAGPQRHKYACATRRDPGARGAYRRGQIHPPANTDANVRP